MSDMISKEEVIKRLESMIHSGHYVASYETAQIVLFYKIRKDIVSYIEELKKQDFDEALSELYITLSDWPTVPFKGKWKWNDKEKLKEKLKELADKL